MPDKNDNRRGLWGASNQPPASLTARAKRDVLNVLSPNGRHTREANAALNDSNRYNSRNQNFKGSSPTLRK